ncbi:hypothetical protein [Flavobacterium sp. PL12]|uniref:hypothetical protein n=1 Tax=Flavobacterium sp. PL12 TaxID=3071718 RepID=UPI00319E9CC7
MTLEEIKYEILNTYTSWKSLDDSIDDDKYAEIDEGYIRTLIATYCEEQGYEVDGFPTEKRELGKTDDCYDEDYFTWERDEKYIDILCLEKEDVLELRLFYYKTFWSDQVTSSQQVKDDIKFNFKNNLYKTDF